MHNHVSNQKLYAQPHILHAQLLKPAQNIGMSWANYQRYSLQLQQSFPTTIPPCIFFLCNDRACFVCACSWCFYWSHWWCSCLLKNTVQLALHLLLRMWCVEERQCVHCLGVHCTEKTLKLFWRLKMSRRISYVRTITPILGLIWLVVIFSKNNKAEMPVTIWLQVKVNICLRYAKCVIWCIFEWYWKPFLSKPVHYPKKVLHLVRFLYF